MARMYIPDSELRKDGQPVGLNHRRVLASARAFADVLAALMDARGLTAAMMAKRLRYSDSSTVGHVLAARVSFPVKRAGDFADALGLAGPEREDFIDQATLSTCPERVQALVSRARGVEPVHQCDEQTATNDNSLQDPPPNPRTNP